MPSAVQFSKEVRAILVLQPDFRESYGHTSTCDLLADACRSLLFFRKHLEPSIARLTETGIREPADVRAATCLVALDEWEYFSERNQARSGMDAPGRDRRFPKLRCRSPNAASCR